jgi:acyl carrier protein
MAITEHDIEQFAARIRLHFAPELRDIAFDFAHSIAGLVGVRVKLLRPETTIDEIFAWVSETDSGSLDKVEWLMALEEELGLEISDELAARIDHVTFRELVEYAARRRRGS